MDALLVTIDKNLADCDLIGTKIAPTNGHFLASLKADPGANGGISAKIYRDGRLQWTLGLSVQKGSNVNVPEGSFSFYSKKDDVMEFTIRRQGTVSGGIGFASD